MKRYYSHYTFIYPDIYLKNYIVEIDDDDKITGFFPFSKEIEKTGFYSGLLVFIPVGEEDKLNRLLSEIKSLLPVSEEKDITCTSLPDIKYKVYHEENI